MDETRKLLDVDDQTLLGEVTLFFYHEGINEAGQTEYVYMAVNGRKLEAYKQALTRPEGASFDDLAKIGKLLYSGQGKPDKHTKQAMEKLGFSHNKTVAPAW